MMEEELRIKPCSSEHANRLSGSFIPLVESYSEGFPAVCQFSASHSHAVVKGEKRRILS